MQADPNIQAPLNMQNYNRYSYVLNNPMSMTDPSGYFFKKLFKGIKKFVKKYGRIIVAAVAAYYTFGYALNALATTATHAGFSVTYATAGAYIGAGAAAGFVGGAIATGSLRGAVKGALTGAITGGVGYMNGGSVTTFSDAAKQIATSAVGGCAAGEVSGGSCGKGARLAAMVQAITIGASKLYEKVSTKISKSTGEPYNETSEPHVWQKGRPDVGKQLSGEELALVKTGKMAAPLSSDQSAFMLKVAKAPYMDAFAEFHDGLHDYSFIPDDQFSLILTMPPSYAITIAAAARPYSHYYYLDLLDKERRR